MLAVQMEVTLPQVDASVDSNGVNELAHFAAGFQYCFAKDRSFDDPLRSKSEDSSINIETTNTTPLVPTVSRTDTTDDEDNEASVSTFRLQVTVRGFEMNVMPVIPFCKALKPQKLLFISNSTMILSCEGQPPREGNNLIRIAFFVSILVHELTINLELDFLAGAVFTILHHSATITFIVETTSALFPPSTTNHSTAKANLESLESGDSMGIKKNLKGRKISVQRHISQSRQTGGLGIVICMQQHNFSATRELKEQLSAASKGGGRRSARRSQGGVEGDNDGVDGGMEGTSKMEIKRGYYGGGSGGRGGALHNQRGSASRKKRKHH